MGLHVTEPEVYNMIKGQYEAFDEEQFLQFFRDELKPAENIPDYEKIFNLIDSDNSGQINYENM